MCFHTTINSASCSVSRNDGIHH
uniref:Uncharacterized protein n=1 Tax=Anguilla anguilla TaxID=7936 RepID=A0A0E9R619_ANGAN